MGQESPCRYVQAMLLGQSPLNTLRDAERGPGGYSSRWDLVLMYWWLSKPRGQGTKAAKKANETHQGRGGSKAGSVIWGS